MEKYNFLMMWERGLIEYWILTLSILILYIIYKLKNYIRVVRLAWQLNGPPAIPILGNVRDFYDENLLQMISHDAHTKYGPVFRFWMTVYPLIIILQPNDVQQILGNPKHTEKIFFYKLLHNFLGKGLITSDASTWRIHRKILQPLFHVNVLEHFVKTFNRSAFNLVQYFENSGEQGIEITKAINDSIYEILNETVLGNRNKSEVTNSPFRKGQVLFFYRLTHPWLLLDWIYDKTSNGKKEQDHKDELKKACENILKRNESSEEKRISLLESMTEARKKFPNFNDEDIINECCTFMLAGQDSVGTAVALTIFMLAKHKNWQEKCYDELEEVFSDDAREPTLSDLRELRCLEMCIKETLRLYPSVPLFARTLGEDVKIGKRVLPKGCGVVIVPYATHRLQEYYSNPHEFNPERFSSVNSAKRHPYAYLPFSAGSRNCIGYKFALIEIKSVISAVLRKYEFDLVPGKEEISPKFRLTVRVKGGVWIRAHKR